MDAILQLLGCEFKAVNDIFDIFGTKFIKEGGTFIINSVDQDAIAHIARTSADKYEADITSRDCTSHVYCCDLEGCEPTGRCLFDDGKTLDYLYAWTEPFPPEDIFFD